MVNVSGQWVSLISISQPKPMELASRVETWEEQIELVDGGCAERVGRCQQNLAPPVLVIVGQLGDAGGFSRAIDADDENQG